MAIVESHKTHNHLFLAITKAHKKSQVMENNWNIHKCNNVIKNHKHTMIETCNFILLNVQAFSSPQMLHQIHFQITMNL
jgi:hypothetical protein